MKVKYRTLTTTYHGLTNGGIYEVVRYHEGKNTYWDSVEVINDYGLLEKYDMHDYHYNLVFFDVTIKHRNEIINNILK